MYLSMYPYASIYMLLKYEYVWKYTYINMLILYLAHFYYVMHIQDMCLYSCIYVCMYMGMFVRVHAIVLNVYCMFVRI